MNQSNLRNTEHSYFAVLHVSHVKSYTWCLHDVCAMESHAEVYHAGSPPFPSQAYFLLLHMGEPGSKASLSW